MKTEAMSSPQADAENTNKALPELPKRWKSRLQRFQSSLRRSVRLKKRNSPQSTSFVDGEHRAVLENDHENCLANRSEKHVREILAKDKHNGAPTKQLNGTKITSHSHYANGETSLDSYGFDKRKFEQNKTNGNNNQRKKKNVADSTWRPAHVSELAVCSQVGSALPKKSHKSKRQRANTNTERTSLSKSKSLSILTNLFKRSSHSKDKNNRGKNSSFADAETSLSKDFTSTANSTDFDALVTDTVVSSSSIDSFGDNDSRFKGKYYSLKRSKKSLIFPKNYLARSFSLDNSLDPCNDSLMEKSRTLAAIPPCIRVEEYRENCGFFERSLTVEFNPGSCGSVTIDTGPDCREKLTGCSASRTAEVLDSSSHSSGARKNGVEQETVPNITHVAEKSSDAWKRRSAPPILSFSADKSSSNIGSPIFYELKTDIAKVENRSQLESKTDECQSNFSEKGNSSSETVECSDILKSDMGNNLSYGLQKPRKFNSKDVKFKSAMLRSIKKNGKTFHVKSYDGEEDPIIEQTDYLESFEQEPENERLYYLAKDVNLVNELTKDKSNSLYEGTEALGISEHMIDALQGNNYTQDFSDVKSTADWNSSGNQLKENQTVEEKCACENTERLPNERVNKEEEVCEEKFCSATFGQTGHNDSSKQGDCLSCNETRNKLTDTELRRCSPVFPDTSSQEVNPGVLSEQKLRDHIARELITCGLREICNSGQGLARNLKVNSLPCSPRDTVVPAGTMHSSFPDIRKLHSQQLSSKLLDSSDSFSSCSLHVENSFENNGSIDRGGNVNNPLLSNGLSNCSKHGGILKSNLSPAPPEERQRSCSARISSKSPLHQVLQTENRSASCSQLDRDGNDNSICTSPPYVRPRIQSLEELPPCTAAVILRKKKSIIRKTRMKHTASLSFVDNEFNNMIDKSKRHSYGGYSDRTFLELPHLLHRSQSAESQLDSCNSSLQSLNSSSSFTENELGSTFSIMSELSIPGGLDKSLGRSRSVPGFLGTADIRQNSPIPEERASLSEMEWPSKSAENSDDDDDDDDDDDVDGEMDVPEAFAEALWDHVTMDPEELSFQAGDIITVLTMTSCEWWFGQVGDQVGWFPAPFVRVRVSQTLAAEETKLALPVRTRKGTFEGFLSDDVIRSRVVLEVLNTERDYVKNLEDVVEGYLKQARKRTDMFSEEQIGKIFSNIEDIYLFNQKILRQLEECFMEDDPHASEIGAVFLNNKQGFDIYSEYCNNHPHAMAELKTLCKSNKYKQFFEACRLLRDMISISLDGFLLTPVQKICKYPLQLAELKKHTSPVHKDFQMVKQALETMKDVASLINERKRKVESINKIAKWQSTIEGWEGENVLERSSELIHSGDVVKTGNGSSQDRVMFLFDHQLVYCKKDILKKNGLTYKGRIDMDDCTVIWLRDGEETLDRSPLNNAWKIYNFKKEKWYIFFTKKAAHKERWIKAFEDERRRVKEDAKTGLIISQNTRKAAMRAAKASMKYKKVNGKKEKPFQKTQSTREIKAPPSPTLQLPDPISSADLKEQEEEDKEFGRSSVIRRSFGLRGSKKGNKDKRLSSVF